MSGPPENAYQPRPIWRIVLNNLLHPVRADESDALRRLAARPTSITLRHLDCGSCNGCELQLVALGNPRYDVERYGISFESSPRHASYLAMTGPYTRALAEAANITLEAMPEPAIIAIGDCAVDDKYFCDSYAVMRRPEVIEHAIKHKIPGCPPSPMELLEALAKIARGGSGAGGDGG